METVALVELIQGRKILNPGGYPPDEIRFVANERQVPFLANDRHFLGVVFIWFISLTGSSEALDATNRISSGGCPANPPPEGFMIFRPSSHGLLFAIVIFL